MSNAGISAARRPRSFGVEEEYLLLDAVTAQPDDRAALLVRDLAEHGRTADREFLSSQLETATPICYEAAEAEAALSAFRTSVARAAADHSVIVAGTGLPPVGGDRVGTVTPKPRYRAIEAEMRDAAAHQYATGLHVHVEVPSRDAGVDVLARLARWAPALLAMTANSPIWCGAPTGFASWRHLMSLLWPVSSYPPPFADDAEYSRTIEHLVSSGVLIDTGLLTWSARLSEHFPTVEVRIADAQLEARDSVAFAALVRALVDRCLTDAREHTERPALSPVIVNGAVWMAARDGLSATLVDPLTERARPAFTLVEHMVQSVEPELDRFGDLALVHGYVERLRRDGDPAHRQLTRYREAGVSGLLGLYREGSPVAVTGEAGAGSR